MFYQALRRLRKAEHEFKTSLGSIMRPYFTDNQTWDWCYIVQCLPNVPEALVLGSTLALYKLV